MLARAYHRTFGLNVTVSNCSNNYGPKQHPEKLIPKIVSNALAGKEIPIYGDGKNVRDWLYVLDHCKAIDLIFHRGRSGETYNVGGHNEKNNLEIVDAHLFDFERAPACGQTESLIRNRWCLSKTVRDMTAAMPSMPTNFLPNWGGKPTRTLPAALSKPLTGILII